MAQENINTDKKRNASQYWIIGVVIVIVLLVGFSTLFGSSFSREEIRSTAYVLAALRLTQDAEVQVLPTLQTLPSTTITLSPSQPESTTEPIDCPADELTAWKDTTSADIETLEAELVVLQSGVFTEDELIDIQARVLTQKDTLLTTDFPSCVTWLQQRLRRVYIQFTLALQAVTDDDLVAIEFETEKLVTDLAEFRGVFENFIERFGSQ